MAFPPETFRAAFSNAVVFFLFKFLVMVWKFFRDTVVRSRNWGVN